MKHEKIYYTCDRCGKEIGSIISFDKLGSCHAMDFTEEQIAERYKESSGKIICSVGIYTKTYDLCGKCKNGLKKFLAMKV